MMGNIFFKLTNSSEKYTEEYLSSLIEENIQTNEDVSPEYLIGCIRPYYPNVAINYKAFCEFVFEKYGIDKKKKSGLNYFFKLQNTSKEYTENALFDRINSFLKDSPKSVDEIILYLDNSYSCKINHSAIKQLIKRDYSMVGNLVLPIMSKESTNSQTDDVSKEKRPNNEIDEMFRKMECLSVIGGNALRNNDDLFRELNYVINQDEYETIDAVLIIMSIVNKQGLLDLDKCVDISVDIGDNLDNYKKIVSESVKNISDRNMNLACSVFITNTFILQLLGSQDIRSAKDIANANINDLIVFFSPDLFNCANAISTISEPISVLTDETIQKAIYEVLDNRTLDILYRRNGFITGESETLEKLGERYDLTRERVRQIENNGNKKIRLLSKFTEPSVRMLFRIHINEKGLSYRKIDELCDDVGDASLVLNAYLLLLNLDINYRLDYKYNLIFDANIIKISDIEKSVKDKYGKLMTKKQYDAAPDLDKKIINNIYSTCGKNHNMFRLKEFNKTSYLVDLIAEIFPQGYGLYSDEDYERLIMEYKNRLGEEIEIPSKAAIRGLLGRETFCLYDRGKYALRSECGEIPIDLFEKMVDFIRDHLPMVDYDSIYLKFHDELNNIGINNKYHMKGLLDPLLPDDLATKRDYITESENRISAVEARKQYMHSFNGPFTLDDMLKKYPGVQPYVFNFLFYEEGQNGLIQIDLQKYIYANHINITDEQKDMLRNICRCSKMQKSKNR